MSGFILTACGDDDNDKSFTVQCKAMASEAQYFFADIGPIMSKVMSN